MLAVFGFFFLFFPLCSGAREVKRAFARFEMLLES